MTFWRQHTILQHVVSLPQQTVYVLWRVVDNYYMNFYLLFNNHLGMVLHISSEMKNGHQDQVEVLFKKTNPNYNRKYYPAEGCNWRKKIQKK